ncbi:hypothetical protein MRX96_019375 [Rhipicephalus microplus]
MLHPVLQNGVTSPADEVVYNIVVEAHTSPSLAHRTYNRVPFADATLGGLAIGKTRRVAAIEAQARIARCLAVCRGQSVSDGTMKGACEAFVAAWSTPLCFSCRAAAAAEVTGATRRVRGFLAAPVGPCRGSRWPLARFFSYRGCRPQVRSSDRNNRQPFFWVECAHRLAIPGAPT